MRSRFVHPQDSMQGDAIDIRKGSRLPPALGLLLVTIISPLLALRILGGGFSDIGLVWFYNTDLVAWYERALSLLTDPLGASNESLGFPYSWHSPSSSALSLDGTQFLMQSALIHIFRDPITATNLLLLSQFAVSAALAYWLFSRLKVRLILRVIGSISLALVPFTFVQISKPNVAFLWPYIAALLLVHIIFSTRSSKVDGVALFLLGLALGGSGGYAVVYSACALGPMVLFTFFIGRSCINFRSFFRKLSIASVGFLLSVGVQLVIHLHFYSQGGMLPKRDAAESFSFQGFNLSLFMPTQFSGLGPVSQLGNFIYQNIFRQVNGSDFCLGSLYLRDPISSVTCNGVSENLAFPSTLAIFGAAAAIAVLVFGSSNFSKLLQSDRQTLRTLRFLVSTWFITVLISSFGLGLLIAFAIPSVRMWGRFFGIGILLSTLIGILLIDRLLDRITSVWRLLALVLLTLVVYVDQCSYSFDSIEVHQDEQIQTANVSREIESMTRPFCGIEVVPSRTQTDIGQLPWYPEYMPLAEELFAFYAPSRRWSAGSSDAIIVRPLPIGGVTGQFPITSISPSQIDDFAASLLHTDACAVVFDTRSGLEATSPYHVNQIATELSRLGWNVKAFSEGPYSILVNSNAVV